MPFTTICRRPRTPLLRSLPPPCGASSNEGFGQSCRSGEEGVHFRDQPVAVDAIPRRPYRRPDSRRQVRRSRNDESRSVGFPEGLRRPGGSGSCARSSRARSSLIGGPAGLLRATGSCQREEARSMSRPFDRESLLTKKTCRPGRWVYRSVHKDNCCLVANKQSRWTPTRQFRQRQELQMPTNQETHQAGVELFAKRLGLSPGPDHRHRLRGGRTRFQVRARTTGAGIRGRRVNVHDLDTPLLVVLFGDDLTTVKRAFRIPRLVWIALSPIAPGTRPQLAGPS